MVLNVVVEKEGDELWIGFVSELPEVLVYANSADEARTRVQVLALRVLADRLARGELGSALLAVSFVEP